MVGLRFARLELGITQSDLEQKTKVKRWRLSLAEMGLISLSEKEKMKIAKALNVSPENLEKDIRF